MLLRQDLFGEIEITEKNMDIKETVLYYMKNGISLIGVNLQGKNFQISTSMELIYL